MSNATKRVALALHSLAKSDQKWMLSQLDPTASSEVKAYLIELSKNKKLRKLRFEELLQLGGAKTANDSLRLEKNEPDALSRLNELDPRDIERVVATADAYTKWLLLGSEKLPHRTIIAKTLTDQDVAFFEGKSSDGEKALPWLSELAAGWLVEEVANESV